MVFSCKDRIAKADADIGSITSCAQRSLMGPLDDSATSRRKYVRESCYLCICGNEQNVHQNSSFVCNLHVFENLPFNMQCVVIIDFCHKQLVPRVLLRIEKYIVDICDFLIVVKLSLLNCA